MIMVKLNTQLIEWLMEELHCGFETAENFAMSFIGELEAGGGLAEVAPPPRLNPASPEFVILDLMMAAKPALEWFDRYYPPDVFTGVSGDVGAVEVAEIREPLRRALVRAEGAEEAAKR